MLSSDSSASHRYPPPARRVSLRPKLGVVPAEPHEHEFLPSARSCEPVLKWAGGKTRLLPEITARLPRLNPNKNRYFEPFIGGGALFFHLAPEAAQLSDWNVELIHLYTVIRDDVEALITDLGRHIHDPTYYYAVRAIDPDQLSTVERASRTMFLNRTCFNGLYRVNQRGQFNVPFGRYENPNLCPEDRLRAAARALQKVNIVHGDFEATVEDARPGDFVYFDPPYVPLTPTASFTSYSTCTFGLDAQERLARVFDRLSRRGVACMLSNSDTLVVRELYAAHRIDRVMAPRAIARTTAGRAAVGEVIVRNYV